MRAHPASSLIIVFSLLMALALSNSAQAQLAGWSSSSGIAGPEFNRAAGVSFDPVAGLFVVVQTNTATNPPTTETFTFDPDTGVWAAVTGAVAPPGQTRFSFVYDPVRQVHVRIGGFPATGTDPVWEFTLASGWTAVTPAINQLILSASATYVASQGGVMLTGGIASLGAVIWDGVGFTVLSTDAPRLPLTPPAENGGLAYDPVRDVALYFGGERGAQPSDETWEYDFATRVWTQVATAATPPPNRAARMVYDPNAGRITAQLAVPLLPQSPNTSLETWDYDPLNAGWIERLALGATPDGLGDYAFDPVRARGLYAVATAPSAIPTTVPVPHALYAPFYGPAFAGSQPDIVLVPLALAGRPLTNDGTYDITVGGPQGMAQLMIFSNSIGSVPISTPMALLATIQPTGAPINGLSLLGGGAADIWIDPGNVTVLANGLSGGMGQVAAFYPSFLGTDAFYDITPALIGFDVIVQGIAAVPGANPLGLVTTNAIVLSFN